MPEKLAPGSSPVIPVILRAMESPSGSVTPRMETGTIFPFGGQMRDGLAVAPEQSGEPLSVTWKRVTKEAIPLGDSIFVKIGFTRGKSREDRKSDGEGK